MDIRYIDNDHLGERAYSITILENYSRAILASALSPRQDLTAFLIVLYAAIRQHGALEALVSDGGSVFRATQALRSYDALGIRKERIERKQPWQNYVETLFSIQRRMADWGFAKATSWAQLADEHARWVGNYNQQDHTPHRSPQLPLWTLGDGEWLKVLRAPEYAPRQRKVYAHVPPPLLPEWSVAAGGGGR